MSLWIVVTMDIYFIWCYIYLRHTVFICTCIAWLGIIKYQNSALLIIMRYLFVFISIS